MFLDPIHPDGAVARREFPRSIAVFAALAAGLVLGRWVPDIPSALWLSLTSIACIAAALWRGWGARAALAAGAVFLGAGWFTLRLQELPADSLLFRAPESGGIVTVEGMLLDRPRAVRQEMNPMVLSFGGTTLQAPLELEAAITERGRERVSGKVRLRAESASRAAVIADADLIAGDRVRVTAVFSPTPRPLNPGQFDRRLWDRQSGFVGSIRIGKLSDAERLESGGTVSEVIGSVLRARSWLADRARLLLLGDEKGDGDGGSARAEGRALLAALILGEEEPALRESRSAFTRLGLSHALSISGFHIVVLTIVGLFLLRAAGDLGWVEPVLMAGLIVLYLVILPVNAPVWRASLMVLALLLADASGRRYDRLAILGWVAVALILWRPMDLWSMGFQLSFGLVAVMIWMGTPFHQRLMGFRIKGQLPRPATAVGSAANRLKQLVSTNILCCISATPIILYHTGLVSPFAAVTGVVVVPLISLLLGAGYGVIVLGVLLPATAPIVSDAVAALAGWVAWLVRWLDQWPWTSARLPGVSLAWAVAATVLVLYWMGRGYLRDRAAWIATIAVAAWLGAEWRLGGGLGRNVAARVDTLAVGDGSCHLIRSGRDAVLWDCGSLTPGAGRYLIPRAARALGVWRVPTVIVTHPNIDHYNAILDVVEPLGVERVLVGEAFDRRRMSRPWGPEAYLHDQLIAGGVSIRTIGAGERLRIGDAMLEIISPRDDADWAFDNDHSLVATLATPGSASPPVLLCGDIQEQAIAHLRAAHPELRPLVMEAPHHGSAREGAIAWVGELRPLTVLQSTGPGRAGDPRWEHVRRSTRWLCTAFDGAAWAEVLRDGSVRAGSFIPR